MERQGHTLVAGVDEAGRGPLAGPVVAAAAILPPALFSSPTVPGWVELIDDSKVLTAAQRGTALEWIESQASIGVGMASAREIDSRGIVWATRMAMRRAIDNLPLRPSYLVIDYVDLPQCGIPFHALAHGDGICYSIAAASIAAKVTRDRLMEQADCAYPGYGFARHKGYATREHLRQLSERGPSPIHRMSFAPIRPMPEKAERNSSKRRAKAGKARKA